MDDLLPNIGGDNGFVHHIIPVPPHIQQQMALEDAEYMIKKTHRKFLKKMEEKVDKMYNRRLMYTQPYRIAREVLENKLQGVPITTALIQDVARTLIPALPAVAPNIKGSKNVGGRLDLTPITYYKN